MTRSTSRLTVSPTRDNGSTAIPDALPQVCGLLRTCRPACRLSPCGSRLLRPSLLDRLGLGWAACSPGRGAVDPKDGGESQVSSRVHLRDVYAADWTESAPLECRIGDDGDAGIPPRPLVLGVH